MCVIRAEGAQKVKQLDKCFAQMRLGWTSAQDAAVCSDCLSCNRPTVPGNLQPRFAVAFELCTCLVPDLAARTALLLQLIFVNK